MSRCSWCGKEQESPSGGALSFCAACEAQQRRRGEVLRALPGDDEDIPLRPRPWLRYTAWLLLVLMLWPVLHWIFPDL